MKNSLSVCVLLSALAFSAAAADTFVYVSNAQSGTLTGYRLDKQGATLQPLGSFAAGANVMSSVVSPDGKMIYASVRSKPYRVAAFRILADGKLQKTGETPLPDSMAYLSVDRRGHFLLSASFGGDLFAINRIAPDGRVETPPVQVVHTGKRAHAVQVSPSNRYLYVTLLGADQLLQFHFDQESGKVTPNDPPFLNVEKESVAGPRHFVFAPRVDKQGQQNMYILTEMAGNILRLTTNPDGTFTPHETTVSVSPENQKNMQPGHPRLLTGDDGLPPSYKPRIWQADLHLTPDGRYLYSTERTSSQLSAFAVDPGDGHLTYLRSMETEKQPRGFAIDNSGRYLIESGQKSPQISLYTINNNDGSLTLAGRYPTGEGANWVSVVEK